MGTAPDHSEVDGPPQGVNNTSASGTLRQRPEERKEVGVRARLLDLGGLRFRNLLLEHLDSFSTSFLRMVKGSVRRGHQSLEVRKPESGPALFYRRPER